MTRSCNMEPETLHTFARTALTQKQFGIGYGDGFHYVTYPCAIHHIQSMYGGRSVLPQTNRIASGVLLAQRFFHNVYI